MTGWAAKASIPIPVKSDEDVTEVVTSSGFVTLTKELISSNVSFKRDMNYHIKPVNTKNNYAGDDYDEYNNY